MIGPKKRKFITNMKFMIANSMPSKVIIIAFASEEDERTRLELAAVNVACLHVAR
jgi:hypothetical protein